MEQEIPRLRGPRLYARPLRRNRALRLLHEGIEFCRFYVYNQGTPSNEKRQWIKTMNSLISTSGALQRDERLASIEERMRALEDAVNNA